MPPADSRTASLLLGCLSAGSGLPPETRAVAFDWPDVIGAAARHQLVPLLYKQLKKVGARASVPPDVWQRLRLAYFAGASRNARLLKELGALLERLRSAGVRVIVLKGAFLAEAVYLDVALRHMTDIDLMVPRAALPKAYAVLLDTNRVLRLPKGTRAGFASGWELRLPVDAGVDFCWAIDVPGGRSRLDVDGLWSRALPAAVVGVEVLVLSPEDLLLHLCLHATHRHGLSDGLRPFVDIARVASHYRNEMDWPQVVGRAHEWGASRYVGLALQLARNMLDAEVPDDAVERLVPGGVDQRALATARQSVLAKTGYVQLMPFLDWLGAKSVVDMAALSWERVFQSREEMAVLYPGARESSHLFLYHGLRLRDAVRDYLYHTLRRVRLAVRTRGRDPNAQLLNWLRRRIDS